MHFALVSDSEFNATCSNFGSLGRCWGVRALPALYGSYAHAKSRKLY